MKLILPMFVGVFVAAFVVELIRRNNPELADALLASVKRVGRSRARRSTPLRLPMATPQACADGTEGA